MHGDVILASSSAIRSALLTRAGIIHHVQPARIDEAGAKQALLAENASARDIADALAEMKARKGSDRAPSAFVLGCDQTLQIGSDLLSKPSDMSAAMAQLTRLQGQTHRLFSAVVLYQDGRPLWRHIAEARMTMRPLTSAFITAYVARNWPDLSHSVGCYLIEAEGISLFSAIDGEHSAILGLPIPPLIGYLAIRGLIAT
jgi:septum formation protein